MIRACGNKKPNACILHATWRTKPLFSSSHYITHLSLIFREKKPQKKTWQHYTAILPSIPIDHFNSPGWLFLLVAECNAKWSWYPPHPRDLDANTWLQRRSVTRFSLMLLSQLGPADQLLYWAELLDSRCYPLNIQQCCLNTSYSSATFLWRWCYH